MVMQKTWAATTVNSSYPGQSASLAKKQNNSITVLPENQVFDLCRVLRAVNSERSLWSNLNKIYKSSMENCCIPYSHFLVFVGVLDQMGYIIHEEGKVRITKKGILKLADASSAELPLVGPFWARLVKNMEEYGQEYLNELKAHSEQIKGHSELEQQVSLEEYRAVQSVHANMLDKIKNILMQMKTEVLES